MVARYSRCVFDMDRVQYLKYGKEENRNFFDFWHLQPKFCRIMTFPAASDGQISYVIVGQEEVPRKVVQLIMENTGYNFTYEEDR